ncbi:MAG: zeta toxin family protein [Bacteroidales bacterium]|jgi:predicted ABC-type ATPase|nr:zeta toxin family protein [Bacteroidales bacterium]
MEQNKQFYIISGCNGAGKTTASYSLLPDVLGCKEFVNADEIAKGLSPFQPEKVTYKAGRILLKRMQELMDKGETLAVETTLATRTYRDKIHYAKEKGYFVTVIFFWLQSIELAKQRVKERVLNGGHNVENEVIERRYERGIKNLFDIYLSLADRVLIFDNSEGISELIARKNIDSEIIIINSNKFQKLIDYAKK